MSIARIGRDGLNPLVLMNLTGPEREALARVLAIGEAHLGEIPFPELRSRLRLAEVMVCQLREACELPGIRPPEGGDVPEVDWAELLRYAGEQGNGTDEAADARHRAVFAQLKRWLAANGHAS